MGLAFLITTENLQLLSERKVLKQTEYAALLNASDVIEAARAEARRIVERATHDAEQLKKRGYEQGLSQARCEYAQRLVGEALATERQLKNLRSSMARMVVKAVGQFIVGVEPELLFAAALQRVESLIRSEPFISVRVSVESESALRLVLATLSEKAEWARRVSVQADLTLPRGGCVVQTSSGTLEIGIEAQQEAFRRVVERDGLIGVPGSARANAERGAD